MNLYQLHPTVLSKILTIPGQFHHSVKDHRDAKNPTLMWPENNTQEGHAVWCPLENIAANEDINDHWSRDFLDTEESTAERHKR